MIVDNPKVIVSVTSFGKKLNNLLPIVLRSFENQTFKDFKLVLVLTDDDYNNITNDYILTLIKENKIEVLHADENLKCHTKYFFTMQKYRNIPIITVDDDTILPNDAFDGLYKMYEYFGEKYVYAREAIYLRNLAIECPMSTRFIGMKLMKPSHKLFAEGFCGILYPPDCLNIDTLSKEDIKNMITHDDIFLKGRELDLDLQVMYVPNTEYIREPQLDIGNEYEKESLHLNYNTQQEIAKLLFSIKPHFDARNISFDGSVT